MNAELKRDGMSAGVAEGIKDREYGAINEGIQTLYELIKEIEANSPFGSIRQRHAASLDALVNRAGQDRDVKLLARLHKVIFILETEDSTMAQKDTLIAQISHVEKIMQGKINTLKPAANGILTAHIPPAPPDADDALSEISFIEAVLRTFPPLGEKEIAALKAHNLLDEERLLNTDATEITRITGLTTQGAFEVKELLLRSIEERAKQDVARRVMEMQRINEQLSVECERVTAANNTMFTGNKELKSRYAAITEQHDAEVEIMKVLQSRVVSARIESNRLSTEIDFLREERQKLHDLVEEKHLLLDDLFKRFSALRSSFEFVSGETGFAQDIMSHLEGLLSKAMTQKKSLKDKIVTSEESLEKLFTEFNEIVRKGKTEFYKSI